MPRRLPRSRSRKPPSAGSIAQWCRERLAPQKVPRYVVFVNELPHTPTHKVAKALMRSDATLKARAVAEAGAFAVVLEMVPGEVAKQITEEIPVPTVGIGAGPDTDAQVLVWQDMAGMRVGGPYRVTATITEGLHAGSTFTAVQGSDVPQIDPDTSLTGDTVFVGLALDDVVRRAMAKQPGERYQSRTVYRFTAE